MGDEKRSVERDLLSHVEALTRHRDVVPLNVSVLSALRDLLHFEYISLFQIIKRDDQSRVALAAWIQDGTVQCNIDFPSNAELGSIGSHPAYLSCLNSPQPALTEIRADDGLIAYLPVILGNEVAAFFEVQTKALLTPHQIDVIEGIVGVYRNFLSLLKDSQHDELTGLLNRKTFDHGMANLLSAVSRTNPSSENERRTINSDDYWLAIIDIDFFKRINDQFGHLYGDEVLILMADLMRKSFRQQDRLYRFGGEEFVVLMRHIDFENVTISLERFCTTVIKHSFPQVGRVTVSIGFAPIRHSQLASVSLGNADEALYYAKEHGRNQVQCYTTLIESGQLTSKRMHGEVELF
ncbi:diguanylate cyclase [Sulfuricella sp. T08]|uniref:GGDEF domain-containing protein n=1 Tax=Sulfuricella sp. T08 TaxID=1632857 RepID=UPI0006179E03|nr:GGDEF domain-containing protein [Sulfuricella sp. T08]GAO36466.1 diguanylate cyclase [Sulfuricella sp. T08]